MKVALIGAELEENLGLRYIGSALEQKGHQTRIFPFNSDRDSQKAVEDVLAYNPDIAACQWCLPEEPGNFAVSQLPCVKKDLSDALSQEATSPVSTANSFLRIFLLLMP
jgi:hypothetical protein